MSLASALGFGLASMMWADSPTVGFNVAIGVFCFLAALFVGVRRAVCLALEEGLDD